MEIFEQSQVGAPIMRTYNGCIYIYHYQAIMDNLVDINTVKGMSEMLITRGKVMNNDIIRIDTGVSGTRPST